MTNKPSIKNYTESRELELKLHKVIDEHIKKSDKDVSMEILLTQIVWALCNSLYWYLTSFLTKKGALGIVQNLLIEKIEKLNKKL